MRMITSISSFSVFKCSQRAVHISDKLKFQFECVNFKNNNQTMKFTNLENELSLAMKHEIQKSHNSIYFNK